MSKKSRHSHSAKAAGTTPQPAQLDAVRRLSRAGRVAEARTRVREMLTRFPDFKPLLALAWEVEDQAGDGFAASSRAWDWTQASPRSAAALEALRDSAFGAGLNALGASALKRLAEVEGKDLPDLPPMPSPFGDLAIDQARAIDLSRMFLQDGRHDAAIAVLRDVDHTSARNNIGITLFAKGEVAAALAALESNWQLEPRNLLALERIVRLRLWSRGRNYAAGLAAPLRATTPLRPDDAVGQLAGLLLLGACADADAAWQAAGAAEYWTRDDPLQRARFDYLGGVAALRLGRHDDADNRLAKALKAEPHYEPALAAKAGLTLKGTLGAVDVEIGEFGAWFPASWIEKLKRIGENEAAFARLLTHCDATSEYLGLAAEFGGKLGGFIAIAMLKSRAKAGDAAAVAELKSLLARPCGEDKVRSSLHAWLSEHGFVEAGSIIRLLVSGEVHDVKTLTMEVTAEPEESDLPPAEQVLLGRVHAAIADRDLDEALHIAEEMYGLRPDHPMVLANLASIKDGLKHPPQEAEDLYRLAFEIDPDYLFARSGLAKHYAWRGDFEAAKEMIEPALERGKYHYSEWRSILITQREMALKSGDTAAAQRIASAIVDLQERFE